TGLLFLFWNKPLFSLKSWMGAYYIRATGKSPEFIHRRTATNQPRQRGNETTKRGDEQSHTKLAKLNFATLNLATMLAKASVSKTIGSGNSRANKAMPFLAGVG